MQVFEERGKPEYPGENISEQRREPTNSTHIYDAEPGNRTRATLVEGECSHHYATTAPYELSLVYLLVFLFVFPI